MCAVSGEREMLLISGKNRVLRLLSHAGFRDKRRTVAYSPCAEVYHDRTGSIARAPASSHRYPRSDAKTGSTDGLCTKPRARVIGAGRRGVFPG